MSTEILNKKTVAAAVGLILIAGLSAVYLTNDESNEVDEEINLNLECPEDFSEGDIITLKVSDGDEGLENASVYIEGDRVGATNRHGNIVVQAPDSSFETEFRYNGEFIGGGNEC